MSMDIVVPWFTISMAFALAGPLDSLEGVILRTAAGTVACGVIWRYIIRPVVRSVQMFFEDHHYAVVKVGAIEENICRIREDVGELRGEVRAVATWQVTHDEQFKEGPK